MCIDILTPVPGVSISMVCESTSVSSTTLTWNAELVLS